jgi:hypothetical protein
VSYHRAFEEVVTGEMVAVGLSIYQVTNRTVFANLVPPPYCVRGHLGSVDHHHSFLGDHKARIAPSKPGFGVHIIGNLFHHLLLLKFGCDLSGYLSNSSSPYLVADASGKSAPLT